MMKNTFQVMRHPMDPTNAVQPTECILGANALLGGGFDGLFAKQMLLSESIQRPRLKKSKRRKTPLSPTGLGKTRNAKRCWLHCHLMCVHLFHL